MAVWEILHCVQNDSRIQNRAQEAHYGGIYF
jgi:hypothetical protein